MAKAGGPQEDQDNLTETGLVARRHLETPEATATLDRLSRDLMRTARPVEEIRGALSWARPKVLRSLFSSERVLSEAFPFQFLTQMLQY